MFGHLMLEEEPLSLLNVKKNSELVNVFREAVLFVMHMHNRRHFSRGGELNFDQTGMCHRRPKFITLFWSGKTQKGYPALELPLLP